MPWKRFGQQQVLTLTRSRGTCIAISTPRGKSGWYFDQYSDADEKVGMLLMLIGMTILYSIKELTNGLRMIPIQTKVMLNDSMKIGLLSILNKMKSHIRQKKLMIISKMVRKEVLGMI